jgi:tetratricopeptide (TPR) repeat protein
LHKLEKPRVYLNRPRRLPGFTGFSRATKSHHNFHFDSPHRRTRDDKLNMKKRNLMILTIVLEVLAIGCVKTPSAAQELPLPRLVPADDGPFSMNDFQRIVSQLKAEREGLDADWKTVTRRLSAPPPRDEQDLEKLQLWMERLERERIAKAKQKSPTPQHAVPEPPVPMPVAEKKKIDEPPTPMPVVQETKDSRPGPVDQLHLGQTLFRVERYEEALEVFRKIDLKGKRPEERVPIVYMTAKCLFHLGKADDAITMLRTAANAPGDERIAGYAQWQIEVLRWYRDAESRLGDVRQRRLATEKRP